MASIHFFAEQINFKLKQKKHIRGWIQDTLLQEKKIPGEFNFIFCSDEFLLHINQTFLNHTTLTDIVTFPIEEFSEVVSGKQKREKALNGEIYISIERVKENAKKFNTTQNNELLRVMIHGVLHLCGYGDKGETDAKKMRQKEDFYLKRF